MYWPAIIIIIILVITISILLIVKVKNENYERVMDEKVDHIKSNLIEHFPELSRVNVFSGNRSFTIDKKEIFLCLRDENGNYYDDNMLTYVLLHELSHVICDEIGHTDKFYKIFDKVLEYAAAQGVWDPNQPIVQNYCGT